MEVPWILVRDELLLPEAKVWHVGLLRYVLGRQPRTAVSQRRRSNQPNDVHDESLARILSRSIFSNGGGRAYSDQQSLRFYGNILFTVSMKFVLIQYSRTNITPGINKYLVVSVSPVP